LSITSSKLYFILFPINIYVYRFRLYLHNPSGESNPQMQLFTKMRKIFVKVCHNSRYFRKLQIYGKQFTSYNNEKIAIKLKVVLHVGVCPTFSARSSGKSIDAKRKNDSQQKAEQRGLL
ncbi:MAG: hypothetical protein WC126_04560, partial [Proteiniphilum sp.]